MLITNTPTLLVVQGSARPEAINLRLQQAAGFVEQIERHEFGTRIVGAITGNEGRRQEELATVGRAPNMFCMIVVVIDRYEFGRSIGHLGLQNVPDSSCAGRAQGAGFVCCRPDTGALGGARPADCEQPQISWRSASREAWSQRPPVSTREECDLDLARRHPKAIAGVASEAERSGGDGLELNEAR